MNTTKTFYALILFLGFVQCPPLTPESVGTCTHLRGQACISKIEVPQVDLGGVEKKVCLQVIHLNPDLFPQNEEMTVTEFLKRILQDYEDEKNKHRSTREFKESLSFLGEEVSLYVIDIEPNSGRRLTLTLNNINSNNPLSAVLKAINDRMREG